MTGQIVVSTDLPGLYVNIFRVQPRLKPDIEEHKHVALKGFTGTFEVQGGGALYQVMVIDLDDKYGGGQKSIQTYVDDDAVVLVAIETQAKA